MKALAFVFCYNRPDTLKACADSLLRGSNFRPEQVIFIDDGSSNGEVASVLSSVRDKNRNVILWEKNENLGFSNSAIMALLYAREINYDYVFLIEGDYVFRPGGLDAVIDVFENAPEGQMCLGIAGYDHPNQQSETHRAHIFPDCMRAQVGEDNVNRAALHKPLYRFDAQGRPYALELVSNTCFTSYLNWKNIRKVATEFPELDDLLDQAVSPRENPNYPDSGKYKAMRTVDDGMLSHALSLCWNRWAIKHGIDRDLYGAWLNIRPSVAEHRFQGGTNFN